MNQRENQKHWLPFPAVLACSASCPGQELSVPDGKVMSKDGKIGWEMGLKANLGFRQKESLPQGMRQNQPGLLEREPAFFRCVNTSL